MSELKMIDLLELLPQSRHDATMSGLLGDVRQLDSNNSMIYIGLGVAGLIYVFVIRPMMRKRDPLDRAPTFASAAQQRATERQMQSLLVELQEMARQVTAQLDTRSAKLEMLIQQADQRLAALQSAHSNGTHLPPANRMNETNGDVPPMIEAEVIPPPRMEMPPPPPTPDPVDPAHAEIYMLADEGWSATEIASKLNRPRGEVELILALRGK